jgi:hypothetical protein
MNRKGISSDKIIKVFESTGGMVAESAHKLGISYQAIYKRMNNDEAIRTALEDIREKNIDKAESKLMILVEKGNLGAICFYLKCQGKHRGWVETLRQEHTGKDGGPIEQKTVEPDYSRLTKDELKQLHAISEKLNAKD